MPDQQSNDIQEQLKQHFAALPKVVRDAVTSADIEKQLRILAETHKLHVDQWSALENEVMMTLVGLQQVSELPQNLQAELGVSPDEARLLATDINRIVFEPVREQLERELSHPDAKAETLTDTEEARAQILQTEAAPAPVVQAATPPQPMPTAKADRTPLSSSYTARQASSERKAVEGDPYREPPR